MNAALGFNDPYHDSSFCRIDSGGVHHVELERFTRIKMERQNPLLGFLDLMPAAAMDGVAAIGVVEGDGLTAMFRHLMHAQAQGMAAEGMAAGPLTMALLQELTRLQDLPDPDPQAALTSLGPLDRYHDRLHAFVTRALDPATALAVLGHHHAHCANAFLSSPFERAISLSLDGGGYDFDDAGGRITAYGAAYRCSAEPFWMERMAFRPDVTAAGAFARVCTGALDLVFGEEGTAMAMAAYGDPARFGPALDAPWVWATHDAVRTDAGGVALAAQLDGLRRQMVTEQDRFDLAAALQARAAAVVRTQLATVVGRDDRALCLSGGLFLNCQIVGQVQAWFPWIEHVFVPPVPYDGGLSIGAAQWMRHGVLGVAPPRPAFMPFASAPGGPLLDIVAAIRSRRLVAMPATVASMAARLAAGQIGARFEGGAESGRRALGYRSILADPRTVAARDRINADIKHRAPFRPLAPMVLADAVQDWFECPPGFASPSMSHALRVRARAVADIPAVVHRDGTARVQTVHAALTPGLHTLLMAFADLTGVPVLLNTSFNDQEPIVQTADQAIECFVRTGLDFLYFSELGVVVVH